MRVFDRIDSKSLDRRERELWFLAIAVMAIMSIGTALLMAPQVIARQVILTEPSLRTAFFSFCTLSALLVAYLMDRHFTIRRLRRRLTEELERNTQLRYQASADLLAALPGFDNFQDRLAMGYLRATNTQEPLSLLVVELRPSHALAGTTEIVSAFGDAGKALTRRLPTEDSVFLFAPGVFGVLLPGIDTIHARRMADLISEGLQDASGASSRFTCAVRVINYPEDATSEREVEAAVHSVLTGRTPEPAEIPALSGVPD